MKVKTNEKSKCSSQKSQVITKLSQIEKDLSYFIKDNFWTKEFFTTSSSFFLNGFNPGEEATVIKLLKKAGFVCIGKADLDEFACGGSGLLSKNGILTNPHNSQHITGGSSSGSAVMVTKNLVSFALGSDTGGSVRCPASYCGIIGFKPTYGLISRYGLIPLSSSLDTVGILGSNVEKVKNIFSIINKKDSRDLLTLSIKKSNKKDTFQKINKKIAIIKGLEKYLEIGLERLYHQVLNYLRKENFLIEEVELPKELRENLQLAYLIISCSELLSHLNSLQGIVYGRKENISITKKRSDYLGKEVKKRLLMGAYFLDNPQHLEQARKLRSWNDKWVKNIFSNYEFLLFPSMNSPAPKTAKVSSSFAGSEIVHWSDNLLLIANFSGIPSLSMPIGMVGDLPVSININGPFGKDKEVLEIAKIIEDKNNKSHMLKRE